MLYVLCLLAGTVMGSLVTLLATRPRSSYGKRITSLTKPASSMAKSGPSPLTPKPVPSVTEPESPPSPSVNPSNDRVKIFLSFLKGKVGYEGPPKGLLIVFACLVLLAIIIGVALRFKLLEFSTSTTPQASAAPPPIIINIRNVLQNGRDAPRYRVDPVANREVVSGLVGSYYYIDLKNAASQRSLFFDPRQYIKNEFDNDFRDAMAAFREDVLRHVKRDNIPYQLFVRGSADITGSGAPYLGELIEGESKTITYLPLVAGNPNQYSSQATQQIVPKKYKNADLPNLRAAYVQEKLRALGYDAQILEGSVTKSDSKEDRYAVMLLYVNWPDNATRTPTR